MDFKILHDNGTDIISYDLPIAVLRNGNIMNRIDDIYFNEKNRKENQNIFFKYLDNIFTSSYDQNCLSKFRKEYDNEDFSSKILQLGYGLTDEQRHVISNIFYNLSINASKSLAYNIFLMVSTLPNLQNEESAFIIKNKDLPSFVESLELLIKTEGYLVSNRYNNDVDDFINIFKNNEIKDDIILVHSYYFSEDFEIQYGYGQPDELLMSDDFQLFLKENKGDFNGYNYNEIVENYIEENDIKLLSKPIFNAYKEHIVTNNVNRIYIDIEECQSLIFIHNDLIESFKK